MRIPIVIDGLTIGRKENIVGYLAALELAVKNNIQLVIGDKRVNFHLVFIVSSNQRPQSICLSWK